MFGRKKKQRLFGASIQPDCALCQHSIQQNGRVFCSKRQPRDAAACKQYRYDPLRREPRKAPPLKEHDPKEFEL